MEDQNQANRTRLTRKRVKLECFVCHRQFDDDYQAMHNKTFHHATLEQSKAIPYQNANAQLNPFEAAKKAHPKSSC